MCGWVTGWLGVALCVCVSRYRCLCFVFVSVSALSQEVVATRMECFHLNPRRQTLNPRPNTLNPKL